MLGEQGVDIDPEFRRDIRISEDFSARVIKARNDLRPFLRKAKLAGQNTYMKYDTVIFLFFF